MINYLYLECPLSVSTSPLNIPATCVILSHCTAIDCCVDVEFLHRSFHVLFDLNVCNNTFTIGIDRLQLEPMNLTSIEYGLYHLLVQLALKCDFFLQNYDVLPS